MRLVGLPVLEKYKARHPQLSGRLDAWIQEVKSASWGDPHDLTNRYPKASIIKKGNVVFKIHGNRYRLWVKVNYGKQVVLVKKIGTHKEYDKWQIP